MSKDHPIWDEIPGFGGDPVKSHPQRGALIEAGLTEHGADIALRDVAEGWGASFAAMEATGAASGTAPGTVKFMVRGRVERILAGCTGPGAPAAATTAGAVVVEGSGLSPAIEAARGRLIAAREAATPPGMYSGSPGERERLRRMAAAAFARGAVSSVVESGIRGGKDEAQMVGEIDAVTEHIRPGGTVVRG